MSAIAYSPDLIVHPPPQDFETTTGGGGQLLYYVSDPNSEALVPDDPTAPAQAAQESGAGPTYIWNIAGQTWV